MLSSISANRKRYASTQINTTDSQVTIKYCRFSNCTAYQGAALCVSGSSSVVAVALSTFTNCTSTGNAGGAISSNAYSSSVVRCCFYLCAANGWSSCAYLSDSNFTEYEFDFSINCPTTLLYTSGSAFSVTNGTHLTTNVNITSADFTYNGGIEFCVDYGGSAQYLFLTKVKACYAYAFTLNNAVNYLYDSEVVNNSVSSGILYNNQNTGEIVRTVFIGNGAALTYVSTSGTFYLINCTADCNTSSLGQVSLTTQGCTFGMTGTTVSLSLQGETDCILMFTTAKFTETLQNNSAYYYAIIASVFNMLE